METGHLQKAISVLPGRQSLNARHSCGHSLAKAIRFRRLTLTLIQTLDPRQEAAQHGTSFRSDASTYAGGRLRNLATNCKAHHKEK
jgi:hypothetical protein